MYWVEEPDRWLMAPRPQGALDWVVKAFFSSAFSWISSTSYQRYAIVSGSTRATCSRSVQPEICDGFLITIWEDQKWVRKEG